MFRTHLAITLEVLGLAVSAAPAAAQLEGLPLPSDEVAKVPAGQIEHTVTTVEVKGSKAVPSHQRIERWMGRDRARQIITDARTGAVLSESTATPTAYRVFDAARNRVTVFRHDRRAKGLPYNAASFEAAVQQAYVERGIVRVVGEQLVDGRRALVTQNVPERWRSDAPENVTTAVVDAETFRLYERSTVAPDGSFSQTEDYEVLELLPAADARADLAMARHAGAKVVRKRR